MYFQVHQPVRLRPFGVFDMGRASDYFDSERNRFYLERVSRKCYLPSNELLLKKIEETAGEFRVSFSITGVLLEEFEKGFPEVLDSFRRLVDTGSVEMFNETYYHSLAWLISKAEFRDQVKLHREKVKDIFGVRPRIFRNTEAMYSNEVAAQARKMGFRGIVAEGLPHILEWRSPNHLYRPPGTDIGVFLRNYKLSDDVGFRFSCRDWPEWPLTADKYASWLGHADGDLVNLFLDYETFGEHQWAETGIFDFLEHLPQEALKSGADFVTPSQALKRLRPVGEYNVPHLTSWADVNRDLSAWLENPMQQQAFGEIKALGRQARRKKAFLDVWRRLQTSDHFYYMCTKWFNDGDVHKYFNCYDTPYDAFLNYMNVLSDMRNRIRQAPATSSRAQSRRPSGSS